MRPGLSQHKQFLEPLYQASLSPETVLKSSCYLQVPPATSPERPRFPNSLLFLTAA